MRECGRLFWCAAIAYIAMAVSVAVTAKSVKNKFLHWIFSRKSKTFHGSICAPMSSSVVAHANNRKMMCTSVTVSKQCTLNCRVETGVGGDLRPFLQLRPTEVRNENLASAHHLCCDLIFIFQMFYEFDRTVLIVKRGVNKMEWQTMRRIFESLNTRTPLVIMF